MTPLLLFFIIIFSPPALKLKPASSPTVRQGILKQISASSLTLQTSSGEPQTFTLSPATRFWRNSTPGIYSDFTPGLSIVLHLRHMRKDPEPTVTDVADAASWKWLTSLRRGLAQATLIKTDENSLTVKLADNGAEFTYRLTEHTLWGSAGKQALVNPFKTGDKIIVLPHSLPSGQIEARAVADTSVLALLLKERLASAVHGSILSLDSTSHIITLHTVSGDTRLFSASSNLQITKGKEVLDWSALHPGLSVVVHIHHIAESDGERIVWKIVIPVHKSYKKF